MLTEGCMACDVLTGKRQAPGGVIYEDDYWRVEHSLNPVLLLGFLIIKTKRHCEQLAELTPEEAAALGPIIHNTCLVLSQILQPDKVYVCSFGEAVKHIHFYIIPRTADMPAGNLKVFLYLRWQAFLHQFGLKKAYSSDETVQVVQQIRVGLQQQMLL